MATEAPELPRRAKPEEYLENIEALMNSGDQTMVAGLLDNALKDHPLHVGILEKGAAYFIELKKPRRAIECALKYIEVSGDKAIGHVLLGDAFSEVGDHAGALSCYDYFLRHNKEDSKTLFNVYKNMGNIYVKDKDFDAAEEFYCKAFALNPHSDALLVNFGILEIRREKMNEARERFRQALEVNKSSDKAWVGLSLIHRAFGDFELAWANAAYALEINPKNETAAQLLLEWAGIDCVLSEVSALFSKLKSKITPIANTVYQREIEKLYAQIGIHRKVTETAV